MWCSNTGCSGYSEKEASRTLPSGGYPWSALPREENKEDPATEHMWARDAAQLCHGSVPSPELWEVSGRMMTVTVPHGKSPGAVWQNAQCLLHGLWWAKLAFDQGSGLGRLIHKALWKRPSRWKEKERNGRSYTSNLSGLQWGSKSMVLWRRK